MRLQDLNTQIQRLEAKSQEDILQQKLQLEKEHIVNSILILIRIQKKTYFILQNQINELKSRHMEDIRGQQLAYNTHLSTIRADHERAVALENEKQNVQHQSNLGNFVLHI